MVVSQHARADPYERATKLLLQVLVVLVGLAVPVRFGASATVPVLIVLLPVWIGVLRRYTLAPIIVVVAVAAVPSGLLLGAVSSVDHEIDGLLRYQSIALLFSGIAAFVVVLWARQELPLGRILVLFALGALASDLSAGRLSWKFDLAVPTTLLVLGLLGRRPSHRAAIVALLVLGVIGVLEDSRSFFGFCLLAATLTAWQTRPRGRSVNRWYPALLMTGAALAAYLLTASLLTGGYLGSELQERSTEQIETSGSILAGGRPEWAATRELIARNPEGYGLGVVPNWSDIQAGKAGLSSIDVKLEPQRQRYMFGGQFKLHSIAADLWVSYGWVGLALAMLILVGLVRSLSFALAARRAQPAVIFITLLAVWHVLFGPIFSNWLEVCVALGLGLATRRPSAVTPPQEAARVAATLSARAPD